MSAQLAKALRGMLDLLDDSSDLSRRLAIKDAQAALAVFEAAPQQEPVAEVYRAHHGGRSRNIGFDDVRPLRGATLPPPGTKLYASPQQAQAPGWRLTRVSDGDIRVYGPDKETWLIRKDCDEGFYDFIYRYFDAAIEAAPQQGSKT